MNLLQAEFKSLKEYNPEEGMDYIVTDGSGFAVSWCVCCDWYPSNVRTVGGDACIELDFEPAHFAEIKIGETK